MKKKTDEEMRQLKKEIDSLQERQIRLRKRIANAKSNPEREELMDRLQTVNKRLHRTNETWLQYVEEKRREKRRIAYANIKPD